MLYVGERVNNNFTRKNEQILGHGRMVEIFAWILFQETIRSKRGIGGGVCGGVSYV